MCGITGFVGPGSVQDLEAMNDALIHRGPDDAGMWCDETNGVFLAMRRLAILDPACGTQPMWSQDGQIGIVFNGEIYNHAALRQELECRGHRFKSHHSDTESLLYGYREWGSDLPLKLNGMWAMCIFDRPQNRLFLCRDRFGQKPLYYTHHSGFFAFGSELTCLLRHPRVDASLSFRALQKYFAFGYFPAPHSACKQIFKLPAGWSATFDLAGESLQLAPYWEFELEPEAPPDNAEQVWEEEFRALLERAVRRRMAADVPVGVFLSGGIDSTTIAHFATKAGAPRPIKTFSIGFTQSSFDESEAACRAARALGTSHENQVLSIDKAWEILPHLLDRLDEPMGDPSLIPTYQLCALARQQVTVALGGDGADELLCGYDPFVALKWAQWYARLVPKPVHHAIRLIAGGLPVSNQNLSLEFKVKRSLRGLSFPRHMWLPTWLGPLELSALEQLFDTPLDAEDVYEEAILQWEACKQPHIVDRTIQFFVKLYLQDDILTKIDRASMMHSLEVRSPFLDIDVVDFLRRLPWTARFRHGQRKYVLKQAMQHILPEFVIKRRKKGFGVPLGAWFRSGELKPATGDGVPFVNRAFIARMSREHQEGRQNHGTFLWNQWLLEAWIQRHGT